MVLGDAFSKLETFVWILNRISRCITKSIILGQLINLNMIFRVVEKLVWGRNSSQSLLNFGTANWKASENFSDARATSSSRHRLSQSMRSQSRKHVEFFPHGF